MSKRSVMSGQAGNPACPLQLLDEVRTIIGVLERAGPLDRYFADAVTGTLRSCPLLSRRSATGSAGQSAASDRAAVADPFAKAVLEASDILALFRTAPVFSTRRVIERLSIVLRLGRERCSANRLFGAAAAAPKRDQQVSGRTAYRDAARACAQCPVATSVMTRTGVPQSPSD